MIKAVVFDWGGVLIEDPTLPRAKHFAAALGVSVERLQRVMNDFEDLEDQHQRGSISEAKYWATLCERSNIPLPSPLPSQLNWCLASNDVFKTKKDVLEIARSLKAEDYQIGLLSNTEPGTVKYFRSQTTYPKFNPAIFSCEEGLRKPEKSIYRLLLHNLCWHPGEVIFIDDRESCVVGASDIGMHGVLFRSGEQLKTDLSSLLGHTV